MVSPEMLGSVMLAADPHAWRLDRSTQLAAVSEALADGARTAEGLRKRFPDSTLQQIACELDVRIVATDDDPLVSSVWRFAEYRPRPPRILLYSRGLAPLQRALGGPLASRLLGRATLQDVFIAHELYHHAETTRSDAPIAKRYRPTLFRIGGWHWRTGIAALAEIAAGAFAQFLLELPCHPKMLDLIALDAISATVAVERVATRITPASI